MAVSPHLSRHCMSWTSVIHGRVFVRLMHLAKMDELEGDGMVGSKALYFNLWATITISCTSYVQC